MKALINIPNEDNEYFRCFLVKYLYPLNKNSAKFRSVDIEFAKQLNFKGVKLPVHKKYYANRKTNTSSSVFGYEDERPYRIYNSKQTFEKHFDLLLL